MAVIDFDDGLSTDIDNTTSAVYTYICKSYEANALTSEAKWICKRVTNANGSSRFANGISDFSDRSQLMAVADGLTATYAA